MENIPVSQRASVIFVVNQLKGETVPTNFGYNDMAVMIAYGQSNEAGIPTVNSDMISRFLSTHPAVPADVGRIHPEMIQGYLDRLAKSHLIDEQPTKGHYRMSDDISRCLVADSDSLKSPHIDEFLFHGFRLFSAWEIRAQQARQST